MAFVGFRIPQKIGKILLDFDLPEKKENIEELHVTILGLGKDLLICDYLKSLEAIHKIYKDISHCVISAEEIITFSVDNDDPYPIVAKINPEPLQELHNKLSAHFDNCGIIHCKKYDKFVPHITLSYSRVKIPSFYIPKIEIPIDELLLWGGLYNDSRIMNTFPLSGNFDEDVFHQVSDMTQKLCHHTNDYLVPSNSYLL